MSCNREGEAASYGMTVSSGRLPCQGVLPGGKLGSHWAHDRPPIGPRKYRSTQLDSAVGTAKPDTCKRELDSLGEDKPYLGRRGAESCTARRYRAFQPAMSEHRGRG